MSLFGFLKTLKKNAKVQPTENDSANIEPEVIPDAKAEPNVILDADQPYLPKVGSKHRVAGLKYREKNALKLAKVNPNYSLDKSGIIAKGLINRRICKYIFTNEPVVLEQEPTNEVDPNAIKVVVSGQHIGYIKAGSCARVNKQINEGRIEKVLCRISGGPYKCVYTGVDMETGKEELVFEKDSRSLSAEIRIVLKE